MSVLTLLALSALLLLLAELSGRRARRKAARRDADREAARPLSADDLADLHLPRRMEP